MQEKIAFNVANTFFGTSGHTLSQPSGMGTLVSVFLSNAITIAGIILLILLAYAGFSMVTAAGDPQKIAQANKIMTYGIMGFILVVASYYIVLLLQATLGFQILQ